MDSKKIDLIAEFLISFCQERHIKANVKYSKIDGYSVSVTELPP